VPNSAVHRRVDESTAERIIFHILNRETGHRVHREFVDAETGKPVEKKAQVKGYETGAGDYIAFEPEEIAKAVPEADKTLISRPSYRAIRLTTSISTGRIILLRASRPGQDIRPDPRGHGRDECSRGRAHCPVLPRPLRADPSPWQWPVAIC